MQKNKKHLLIIWGILALNHFAFSQGTRYLNRVFTQTNKTSNVVYANAPAITSIYVSENVTTNTDLNMDIFQPANDNPSTLRPLIVMIHSGGFILGSKDNQDMQFLCDSFARRGYVTCSINYRKNFNLFSGASAERAVYRGLQDAASAIRYLKKNRNTYQIDTNYVFALGSSAGAFSALNLAFLDETERPASTFAASGRPDLGCINCSGNTFPHNSKVNAIVSCWGAIGSTNWINSNNNVPTLMFHGDADNVVPYNTGSPFGLTTLPPTFGSLPISQRLANQGIYYEFYTGAGKGHEYWGATNGTFATSPTADYQDIINKTAIFLYNRLPATPMTIATTNVTAPTCNGSTNGAATVNATGGGYVCNMTYKWSNGQTGATATNLAAGNYTCTATCGTTSTSIAVVIPQPLGVNTTVGTIQGVTCSSNGSATVNASGGAGILAYLWSNGQNTPSLSVATSGNYTLTVTDANNCKKTTTVNIPDNKILPTANIATPNELNCFNYQLTLNASGSSSGANILYQWSGPGIVSGGTTNSPSVNQSGAYTLTVTNTQNACTSTATVVVSSNKTPVNILVNFPNTINCINKTAIIDASNSTGFGILNYTWGAILVGNNASKITVTNGGTYYLTVTSTSNGCSESKGIYVFEDKSLPQLSIASASTLNCIDSTATMNVTTNATSYLWSGPKNFNSALQNPLIANGGIYNLTVTGSNGCIKSDKVTILEDKIKPNFSMIGDSTICANQSKTISVSSVFPKYNWSNGEKTPSITTSTNGNYSVTITGSNGCIKSKSLQIALAPQPSVLILNDTLTCKKDSLKLNATSASILKTLVWKGPNAFSATILMPFVKKSGNYTLTATTNLGCSQDFSTTIFQDKSIPQVTILGQKNICPNGTTTLTATPNQGNYLWSNGTTSNTISIDKAGNYSLSVTNSKGCKTILNETIQVFPSTNIELTAKVSCDNQSFVTSSLTGGAAPFTYAWNISNATTSNISITAPANVFLTITDANACKSTSSPGLKVESYVPISIDAQMKNATSGKNDGEIILNITSPNKPLLFAWSNGATTKDLKAIASGKYCVVVTDANACTKDTCFIVKETVATNELLDFEKINIYPNPTNDYLYLKNKTALSIKNMTIINESGQNEMIFSYDKEKINVENLPKGFYILKINFEKGEIVYRKFMKL